nr:hypothetical protein BaRGS_003305 [Batillaria attramentaria]
MDVYMPDFFWNLDPAHHGVSPNPHSLYATLHNVELNMTTGPQYKKGMASALRFSGSSSSFAEIANNGQLLDATERFTWAMVLKADSELAEGVILEYWDGTGGIRIKQSQMNIEIIAQDTSGNTYSVIGKGAFKGLKWKFVALSYINVDPTQPKPMSGKTLRLFMSNHNQAEPSMAKEVSVPEGTVLRGTGDVRLGASSDSGLPAFSGQMSCLRYHTLFVMKFSRDADYPLSCDPQGVLQSSLETLSARGALSRATG